MSTETVTSFLQKVDSSDALQAQFISAAEGKSESEASAGIVALGKANGFEFSVDEILAARHAATEMSEMSPSELSKVSGGGPVPRAKPVSATKTGSVTVPFQGLWPLFQTY